MKIADGAATSNVRGDKITDIRVTRSDSGSNSSLNLFVNDSLSYISIAEAVALRDEINNAIAEALGLNGIRSISSY